MDVPDDGDSDDHSVTPRPVLQRGTKRLQVEICGMLCLFIYGLHNLSMLLNMASKLTFLAKPLNKSIVGVVVLFN